MLWDRQAAGGVAVVLVIAVYLAMMSFAGQVEEAQSEASYAQEQAAAAEQSAEEAANRADDLESRLDDLERRTVYRY